MIYITPACISCNKLIRDGIYNSTFYPNILKMLSAFLVLSAIVGSIAYVGSRRHNMVKSKHTSALTPIRLQCAGIVLGIGLGGFIDGIVLHQLLQWHEMLSNKIAASDYVGKSVNMFWDGVFHSFCFGVVLIGIIMLWSASKSPLVLKSGRLLIGSVLSGWGIFNIVEGLINHHWLKLHNVMEYSLDHDLGNMLFLGSSLLITVSGSILSIDAIRTLRYQNVEQQETDWF